MNAIAGEYLLPGSDQEMEIRGCSIWAIEVKHVFKSSLTLFLYLYRSCVKN